MHCTVHTSTHHFHFLDISNDHDLCMSVRPPLKCCIFLSQTHTFWLSSSWATLHLTVCYCDNQMKNKYNARFSLSLKTVNTSVSQLLFYFSISDIWVVRMFCSIALFSYNIFEIHLIAQNSCHFFSCCAPSNYRFKFGIWSNIYGMEV